MTTSTVTAWAKRNCAFCSGAVAVPESPVAYIVIAFMAFWDNICSKHLAFAVSLSVAFHKLATAQAEYSSRK